MSKRVYKSGAEKRKLKNDKDEKNTEFLKKFAKLDDLFNRNNAESQNSVDLPIADTSIENTNDCSNAESTATTNTTNSSGPHIEGDTTDGEQFDDAEFSSSASISNDAFHGTEDASQNDVAECSKSIENLAIASDIYANDPGLWPINSNQSIQSNQANQSILQNHWVKKGKMPAILLIEVISCFQKHIQIDLIIYRSKCLSQCRISTEPRKIW